MTGCITNIKRLAVHDGPGLRTTIFMKGCPLHCRWCHNPESISEKPEIGYHQNRCINCGDCVSNCPTGSHIMINGTHTFNHKTCNACGNCTDACLPNAVDYFGQEISVKQAVSAVLDDKTFYDQSSGGCTLSGGEPLLQPDFCHAVFKLLHSENIHCALDTSGAVKWENFEKVIPETDLVLFDVKHTNDHLHQEFTGHSNKQILDNLKKLSQYGVPLEIRIPTIPDFNANEQSMTAIGNTLKKIDNIIAVRLLPYHTAHSKYHTIGHKSTMPITTPPDQTQMDELKSIFHHMGFNM